MRKEVAKKFGVIQQHISTLIKGIYQKVNFLFGIKPESSFDSYPETWRNKFLKEYTTEAEEVKAMLLPKSKGIATNGV